jgi:hypothetical protein
MCPALQDNIGCGERRSKQCRQYPCTPFGSVLDISPIYHFKINRLCKRCSRYVHKKAIAQHSSIAVATEKTLFMIK